MMMMIMMTSLHALNTFTFLSQSHHVLINILGRVYGYWREKKLMVYLSTLITDHRTYNCMTGKEIINPSIPASMHCTDLQLHVVGLGVP
jgi:hypothetical protein